MKSIEIKGLQKTFRGKKGLRVEALKGISFAVEPGEVFGFLGPNGAGKSTTIKCLMGLIRPTGGTATIMGDAAGTVESRRHVGYLPENPSFYDYLSAEEYLAFVGRSFKMPADELARRSEDVLKRLELWEARKRLIRSYSKGMVQRVGLAQTLLHDPDIYILDEPMSGLDPLGRALVKQIMLELRQAGKTVFFSTHIIDDVEKVCDRVAIILKGELHYLDRVDKIMYEGITGYQVRVRRQNGVVADSDVERDELATFLDECRSNGNEVLLVEPRRRHLEDFFLAMVEKHSSRDDSAL